MIKEKDILNNYIETKGLKKSTRRFEILDAFVTSGTHLTADELYDIVIEKNSSIGRATVYRTLKLLSECGLASELRLDDGVVRYELKYRNPHHDHLVCTDCGSYIEVVDNHIEELQNSMANRHGFIPEDHTLIIYGLCQNCSEKN